MHISPPVIWPRQAGEKYADWVMRCMPVDPERNYPVNHLTAWHGGIHLPHLDLSGVANPVRAIADGVIVYARRPSEKPDDLPLAYQGRTDDGCVLIRHEILVGDRPVLFTFYSLTMHMKQVRGEILSNVGQKVKREQILGTAGYVDGKGAFHFQICCEPKMLEVLSGRIHGGTDTAKPGRSGPVYGKSYYFAPAGVSLHAGDAWLKPNSPAYCISLPLYITDDGSRTIAFHRQADGSYMQSGSTATVRHIVEPSAAIKGVKTWSEWILVSVSGQEGWIDVSSAAVKTYTDADLPDWDGWSIVDDDPTPDSQCNSKRMEKWLAEADGAQGAKLMKSICKFPFEWNSATIDTRFSWVKHKSKAAPDPLTAEEYKVLTNYIGALCFFDKLSGSVQAELSGEIWHFEPRTFITQIQKAERRLLFETKNNMNDFTADDMQHGDMSKEQILQQGKIKLLTRFDFDKTAEEHFAVMEHMARMTAKGKYAPLIAAMIGQFKKNTGGIGRHQLLNEAFLEHKTTRECVAKIKSYISNALSQNGASTLSSGDIDGIENSFIRKDIGTKLPKFDDWDWQNGLGITVHDTFATRIFLDYLNVDKGKYKGRLVFHIQDHFGLDIPDLNGKGFEFISWFCSWFILQRYNKLNYKPFINEATFSWDIEGFI
ncbi:DUF3289 family protein [Erwinia sp. B116]|uniref:DUF3289 family protein n=1 Tax=Erwinia sp. B116 TaxID=1561024 RepID=UPI000C793B13|nr:DUF3289 family protein [Erwinia sp. B116]PLV61891.1 hypothetical protein NV64_07305 [Erwinia sp. B116]